MSLKSLLKFKVDKVIDDMVNDAIAWHKESRCECMKDFDGEITRETFVPCDHLKKHQEIKYKNNINNCENIWKLRIKEKVGE